MSMKKRQSTFNLHLMHINEKYKQTSVCIKFNVGVTQTKPAY